MPRAAPLRAIFFDAGNTLIRMDYDAIAAELWRLGVRVTPAVLEHAERRARVRLDTEVLRPLGTRASTESHAIGARYLAYVLEGAGVTDPAAIHAVAEWRRTYNLPIGLWNVAEPTAHETLAEVRAAGVRAAVISNSNGSVRSILDTLGLTRHLDFVIDSGEVGVEKPDPRIFTLTLDRAGVTPDEALYIGDLYSVDVIGARAIGLDAILIDPDGCWGVLDCRSAPDVRAAIRLALTSPRPRDTGYTRGSVTDG
jgi:putative hydrolase of the HAD superfamily